MLGMILFLAACSSRMRGESTTVCTNAPSTLGLVGETTVTIEGMDETIVTWTERTVMNRDIYNQLWQGVTPTDEDIREWFDGPMNNTGMQGVYWVLVSVDANTVVTDYIYYYEQISERDLRSIWATANSISEITLTSAIAGLEELGNATCEID